jgi:predicted NUDIX family NTP pyrophosphohydrolase
MAVVSCGILIYRVRAGIVQVLLVHHGGPYFVNQDKGHWGIPKGMNELGESLEQTAIRELKEETGIETHASLISIGEIKLKSGKRIHAWAAYEDLPDDWQLDSNLFSMEWPPKSGQMQEFPEIDKARYFSLAEAREYITFPQMVFIDRLEEFLG